MDAGQKGHKVERVIWISNKDCLGYQRKFLTSITHVQNRGQINHAFNQPRLSDLYNTLINDKKPNLKDLNKPCICSHDWLIL